MACSIIIPTYNRKKFEKLIEYNIKCQTYPYILEVIIADDGDESQKLELDVPYPVQYIRCNRMSIGSKRNLLCSKARGRFIAHFDTDDIYFPTFIEYSIDMMNKKNKNAIGTSDMIFLYKDGQTGMMRNALLSMANEATLVYRKSFWEKCHFSTQHSNEGIHFLEGRHWEIGHSDIYKVMICLCHDENTVDKNVWRGQPAAQLPSYEGHRKFLLDMGFNLSGLSP
jgi:glycosyltransferase involved in cell wall biosynthesis